MSGPTFGFSIDLPVRSEWTNVELLRTSVQNCFTAIFSDVDGCHALAMVTGELLENAVKYGDWQGHPGGTFRLRVWGEMARAPGAAGRAHVSVENPVRPDDPGVAELFATLRWIEGFATPEAAYRAKLLQIADTKGELGESRLGLVRIVYEGSCTLRAALRDDHLEVIADSTFGPASWTTASAGKMHRLGACPMISSAMTSCRTPKARWSTSTRPPPGTR